MLRDWSSLPWAVYDNFPLTIRPFTTDGKYLNILNQVWKKIDYIYIKISACSYKNKREFSSKQDWEFVKMLRSLEPMDNGHVPYSTQYSTQYPVQYTVQCLVDVTVHDVVVSRTGGEPTSQVLGNRKLAIVWQKGAQAGGLLPQDTSRGRTWTFILFSMEAHLLFNKDNWRRVCCIHFYLKYDEGVKNKYFYLFLFGDVKAAVSEMPVSLAWTRN